MRRERAFTVVELMVVVAVVAIVLALAMPSFRDYMLVQRLKSVNAQLVTDLMLARSEAVSRNTYMRIFFKEDTTKACYSLYTNVPGAPVSQRCDCLAGAGAACGTSASVEVRTADVPLSGGVRMTPVVVPPMATPAIAFHHVTGGLVSIPTDTVAQPLASFTVETSIDTARALRTTVGRAGKVTVCGTSANLGAPLCTP